MVGVDAQGPLELTAAEDQPPVKALAAQCFFASG
jgi:hypothetical protein